MRIKHVVLTRFGLVVWYPVCTRLFNTHPLSYRYGRVAALLNVSFSDPGTNAAKGKSVPPGLNEAFHPHVTRSAQIRQPYNPERLVRDALALIRNEYVSGRAMAVQTLALVATNFQALPRGNALITAFCTRAEGAPAAADACGGAAAHAPGEEEGGVAEPARPSHGGCEGGAAGARAAGGGKRSVLDMLAAAPAVAAAVPAGATRVGDTGGTGAELAVGQEAAAAKRPARGGGALARMWDSVAGRLAPCAQSRGGAPRVTARRGGRGGGGQEEERGVERGWLGAREVDRARAPSCPVGA